MRGGRVAQDRRRRVTADALVRAYRKETERQRILVKKASIAQGRLLFVVNALRRLFADEHFVTLLRAERLVTVPTPIAERLNGCEATCLAMCESRSRNELRRCRCRSCSR